MLSMCISTESNSSNYKLIKKRLTYVINLNSEQFCLELFFEEVNLTSILCIGIDNERRLISIVKVLLYHFIYTFIFTTIPNDNELCLHSKTIMKLKAKLKALTGRSNGMGYARRKEALSLFIRGWVEYYKLARMRYALETIDHWLRRRIRMCIWKSWKNPRTRIANLIKCGVPKWQARKHGWVKGYWRAAKMWDCTHAMSNKNLYRAGYRCLMDYYVQVS